jgi:hypothetical protein
VFHSAEEARGFIESELQSQRPPEQLRAFVASETPIQVSYRPVVSLGARGQSDEQAPRSEGGEPIPNAFRSEVSFSTEPAVKEQPAAEAPETQEAEEEDGRPYEKDGVRFSSLFKPSS